jgi:hypothetical protein
MAQTLLDCLKETVVILALVTAMMVVVEFVGIRFQERLQTHLTGSLWNQYVVAALLGVLPGCTGSFMVVSLYVHGIVGFGALMATLIATSGDESFVMLAQIPCTVPGLFALCFGAGVVGGALADRAAARLRLPCCRPCEIEVHAEESRRSLRHFLTEHVWAHLLKRHVPRLFAWVFVALLALKLLPEHALEGLVPTHRLLALGLATLVGLIPSSGPHLLFVFAFRDHLVPFSVLAANSIVQDGHALLPLLAFSVRDSIAVKVFGAIAALIVGLALMMMGC